MDIELASGYQSEPYTFSYSCKEAILYNLGVGISTLDEDGLRFLYEHHFLFAPLHAFGVLPSLAWLDTLLKGGVPGISVDLSMRSTGAVLAD